MGVRWLYRQLLCITDGCHRRPEYNGSCARCYYKLKKYKTTKRVPVSLRAAIIETHPEIASELFDKSLAYVLTQGSRQKVTWVCKNGHRYFSMVSNRTKKHRPTGCPLCLKPWAQKSRSLLKKRPDLAKEAFLFDPSSFGTSSKYAVWWLCSKCCHLWKTRICHRVAGNGCPNCNRCTFKVQNQAWMYLLKRPGQQKVGITNKIDGKDNRLTHHRGNGWNILDVIGPYQGRPLKDLENRIKAGLDSKGIPRGKLAFREWFDGYSEAWQTVDFEVSSIAMLLTVLGVGGIEHGQRQETGNKSFTQDGIQPATWFATGCGQVLGPIAGAG